MREITSRCGGRRGGFTLIELLVVIAIIAVLIGLLLPAVQKVREAASRAQCENNLKQMALACHGFHDVNERFPQGVGDPMSIAPGTGGTSSWMWTILPFIEQESLYKVYYFNPTNGAIQYTASTTETVFGTLPLFYCPSEPRSYPTFYVNQGTDYVGIEGVTYGDTLGIIHSSSANYVRVTDVTDGTSNTVMLGERPPSATTKTNTIGYRDPITHQLHSFTGGQFSNGSPFVDSFSDPLSGAANHDPWMRYDTNQQGQPCPAPPRYFGGGPFNVNDNCSFDQIWSFHTGGVNFAMGDGSVHFISYSAGSVQTPSYTSTYTYAGTTYTIPLTVLCTLATRAGGEVTEVPD